MKFTKQSILFFFFIFPCFQTIAQTLPVGTPVLEEYYRRNQLMGGFDPSVSFTIRPLSISHSLDGASDFYPDSAEVLEKFGDVESSWKTDNGQGRAFFLPVSMQTQ